MRSFVLRSPAKVNLYLRVIGKRPDGYHDLVTIFERINLCDDIHFRLNQKGHIRIFCDNPDVPRDSRNIVYKTAQLLRQDFSVKEGVDIKIVKRIPVAAGLGGGSSNGATALLGLNALWKLSLNKSVLLKYARKIGSDVPFFIEDTAFALGTQRGDYVKKLSIRTKLWHVLVIPRVKVFTRDIFGAFRRPKNPEAAGTNLLTNINRDVNILIRSLRNNDLSQVGYLLANDLETTLLGFHPNLINLKKRIEEQGAFGAVFSGSGPSIFGLVGSKAHAQALKKIFKRRYSRVFIVKTC